VRMVATMTYGWKAIVLHALEERLPDRTSSLATALATFNSPLSGIRIAALLLKGVLGSRTDLGPALTHVAGLLGRKSAVKRATAR
jgi:hypothetical protein